MPGGGRRGLRGDLSPFPTPNAGRRRIAREDPATLLPRASRAHTVVPLVCAHMCPAHCSTAAPGENSFACRVPAPPLTRYAGFRREAGVSRAFVARANRGNRSSGSRRRCPEVVPAGTSRGHTTVRPQTGGLAPTPDAAVHRRDKLQWQRRLGAGQEAHAPRRCRRAISQPAATAHAQRAGPWVARPKFRCEGEQRRPVARSPQSRYRSRTRRDVEGKNQGRRRAALHRATRRGKTCEAPPCISSNPEPLVLAQPADSGRFVDSGPPSPARTIECTTRRQVRRNRRVSSCSRPSGSVIASNSRTTSAGSNARAISRKP